MKDRRAKRWQEDIGGLHNGGAFRLSSRWHMQHRGFRAAGTVARGALRVSWGGVASLKGRGGRAGGSSRNINYLGAASFF
jgi:hypothetical protein